MLYQKVPSFVHEVGDDLTGKLSHSQRLALGPFGALALCWLREWLVTFDGFAVIVWQHVDELSSKYWSFFGFSVSQLMEHESEGF